MTEIRQWVLNNEKGLLDTAMDLIRIRSVSGPREGDYPYGAGCARVLERAMEIGRNMGFEVQNHEYHCASLLYPGRTEREIGIFAHLDVVHEGEGWSTDPYEPVLRNGWLFGRGSADNKGPAAAALYALTYLKEHGIVLNHRIRLYLGGSEEAGMEDIKYYTAHYPAPEFSFTPDASFPVCYGEKGILTGEFSRALPDGAVVSFEAGVASNSIPSSARVLLRGVSLEQAREWINALENRESFCAENREEGICVAAFGRSAHAAFPEGADSAAVKLAAALIQAPFVTQEEREAFRLICQGFGGYYGEGMGVAFEDKLSGPLTLAGGMVRTENGRLIQNFNMRYSICADREWIQKTLRQSAGAYGWETDWMEDDGPCVIDPESRTVKELTRICCQVTGIEMEAYSMGGGTYARRLPNAIAFGPGIRGQKKPCPPGHGGGHQPDECVKVENLLNGTEIYIRSLLRLDEIL